MRIITILTLLSLTVCGFSQTLTNKDISDLQIKLKTIPNEPVGKDEVAVIETEFGNIVVELYAEKTPGHAGNFKKLVNAGYYTGTTFHRVIPGFVVQGGDLYSKDANPANDGTGGPGYDQKAELGQKHLRGCLAAARLPDQVNPEKRSSGSQFYFCLVDLPSLDEGGYTVFGKVIKGMNVVDKIATVERDKRDRPIKNVVMNKVFMTTNAELKKIK